MVKRLSNTDQNSRSITNVPTPSSGGDAVNKTYADTASTIYHPGGTDVAVADGGTGQSSYTNGQLLIGNTTGNTLAKATLTQGTGISITNGGGSITIAATGSAIAWSNITGTTQAAAINSGYITNNASLVTITLPSTAAVGSIIEIAGAGAGGWRIAQNSGQVINFGVLATTSGTGGRLDSVNRYDAVRLICITANTTFSVISSQGNITVT